MSSISRRSLLSLAGTTAAGIAMAAVPRLSQAVPVGKQIRALYGDAIVIDALSVAHGWDDETFAAIDASGYTGIVTSLPRQDLQTAINAMIEWRERVRAHPDRFLIALTASDFERAKREGKLAVLMNFQNATMLEGDADNVEALHALGMRCFQLTYNERNLLGDGSTERTDAGLSDFGVEVVGRMNQVGVLVDLSHCGRQTTLDGIAISDRPVAFTHTMCEALRRNHPRAKTDDQIRALADKGGVIGIAALGYFIGRNPGRDTTIETYLDHVDHAVSIAGTDHVALSTDFQIRGIKPWATRENWYEPRLEAFKSSYDVQWPPWIPELDAPDRFLQVAARLSSRGYRDHDIEKLLGLNWLRLFRETIG
ncbi:MAG: membrane dipeptidase [Xanthomonadales bacterium]|nr:membrane dipeptidase [Xanthomonadales bacterium]